MTSNTESSPTAANPSPSAHRLRAGTATIGGLVCWTIAAASMASAAIHFSVIGEHFSEAWYFGVFFVVVAWAQVAWAVAVVVRPSRRLLVTGATMQLLLVVIYLWSRTTGLPIGPEPWQPESVAFVDLVATVLEAVAGAGALVLVLHTLDRRLPSRVAVAALGVVALLVGGVTSAGLALASPEMSGMSATAVPSVSTADESGSMPGMAGMAGMAGNDSSTPSSSAADGSATTGTTLSLATTSPAGSITWPRPMGQMEHGMQMAGPACTADPGADQQQAAVSLVDQTVADTASFRSLAAAKAAGYVPITPSGRPVVHYVNPAYYAQTTSPSVVLNPEAPQSLVYANTATGPVLVAAMYIMPAGSTATPDPGGCLTQWHIHTNLCFSSSHQVVGTDNGGSCPAGSTSQVTQPMMHVWLASVPGGPLAVDASGNQILQAAKALPAVDPATSHA